MYFLLSKTIGALLTPSTFVVVTATIGLLLILGRRSVAGQRLLVVSSLLMAAWGLTPLGSWLLSPLENRFPVWSASRGKPSGIIVLGGSIDAELSAARGFAVIPSAADRLIAAAELARRYPDIPIVFTGGSSSLAIGDAREADFAPDIFQRLGLPKGRIVFERESRNTIENAARTKSLADPKPSERWLLITSAYHMPRSVGLFRTAGFHLEAYPVDYLTPGDSRWFWVERPMLAISRTDLAIREWMGLLVDWMFGGSRELFPSPTE